MTSGYNKKMYRRSVFLLLSYGNISDDSVDEAFRVIPASHRTGPWSHRLPGETVDFVNILEFNEK